MNQEETTEPTPVPNDTKPAETKSTDSPQEKWVETKREYEIDDQGNERVKRITREIEKPIIKLSWWVRNKDIIDSTVKLLGLVSISLPFFLFFLQQKEENRRQKGLLQLDVYSGVSIAVHSLISKDVAQGKLDSFKFKLFYELYPKIQFLNDTEIIREVEKIKPHIETYILYKNSVTTFNDLTDLINTNLINGILSGNLSANSNNDPLTFQNKMKTVMTRYDSVNITKLLLSPCLDSFTRNKLSTTAYSFNDLFNHFRTFALLLGDGVQKNVILLEIKRRCFQSIVNDQKKIKADAETLQVLNESFRLNVDSLLKHLDSCFIKANTYYK